MLVVLIGIYAVNSGENLDIDAKTGCPKDPQSISSRLVVAVDVTDPLSEESDEDRGLNDTKKLIKRIIDELGEHARIALYQVTDSTNDTESKFVQCRPATEINFLEGNRKWIAMVYSKFIHALNQAFESYGKKPDPLPKSPITATIQRIAELEFSRDFCRNKKCTFILISDLLENDKYSFYSQPCDFNAFSRSTMYTSERQHLTGVTVHLKRVPRSGRPFDQACENFWGKWLKSKGASPCSPPISILGSTSSAPMNRKECEGSGWQ